MARSLVLVGKVGPKFGTDFASFFSQANLARLAVRYGYPAHSYPAGEDGAFTMCECPEGRECHNCK